MLTRFGVLALLCVAAIVPLRADPAATPGKVEVIEFFSYGCPHCFHFQEPLLKWVAGLPPDVEFQRMPVSLGYPQWIVLSRAYYALDAAGLLARADDPLFKALHVQKLRLYDGPSFSAWLRSSGFQEAEAQKFLAAFDSDEVAARVAQAERMGSQYRIDSTPTLLIDRRYRAGGLAGVDQLIGVARTERRAAAARLGN